MTEEEKKDIPVVDIKVETPIVKAESRTLVLSARTAEALEKAIADDVALEEAIASSTDPKVTVWLEELRARREKALYDCK